MPSDRDLDQQLAAFGATLADRVGEPVRPDGAAVTPIAAARSRRRWAFVGAAACVVALVAGLLLIDRRDAPEQGAAAPTTAAASTVPSSGAPTASAPSPTAPPAGTIDPSAYLSDDPLGLIADGWVRVSRDVEAFDVGADDTACEGLQILAGLVAQPVVHEIYTAPALPGFDLDVTYMPVQAGPTLSDGFAALADCPEIASGGPVEAFASSDGASGFRLGEEFALVAVAPDAPMVPLAIALELESVGVTDELISDLQSRALAFLAAEPAAPTATSPTTPAGEVPVRQARADELAVLDGGDRGLVCDASGIGGAEWDYGEISDDEPRGRRPVDAFRDAVAELSAGSVSEGGVALPTDGWTELVTDDSQSYFALEVDGVRQGVISVSGDPALGVWRHGSADLCQSLFLPDGYVPPTTAPAASTTAPPRQPPITTAPGAIPLAVEAYPTGTTPPVVAADEPVFVLVVSNQSFEDDTVGMVITIDGQVVADDAYEVREQHTTSTYHVRGLAPGAHDVEVATNTGVGYGTTIRIPESGAHWAYVTYWYYPDDAKGRYVDLTEFDEPVAID